MLVVMQAGATEPQVQNVINRLVDMGFTVHRSTGVMHTVLGGVGPMEDFDPAEFEVMDGVKECHRIVSPYKLASRTFRPAGTVVKVRDVEIGGNDVVVMAGPCSVETRDQIELYCGIGCQCRRQDPPRGRIQTAKFAVELSGTRRGRVANDARSGRPAQSAGR